VFISNYGWIDLQNSGYNFKITWIRKVSHNQDLEELIADSMTGLMIRAERLSELDQLAISEEFREWLNEGVRIEDVLKLVVNKK
jgi:hypothetical protein